MANGKKRAQRPSASSWDKISARDPGQTLTNRDVHGSQQLDRGIRQMKKSKTPGLVVGIVVGVVVTLLCWVLYSVIAMALMGLTGAINGAGTGGSTGPKQYYLESTRTVEGGAVEKCYQQLTSNGQPEGTCYPEIANVPVPDWYTAKTQGEQGESGKPGTKAAPAANTTSLGAQLADVTLFKLFLTAGLGLLVGVAISAWWGKRVDTANLMHDDSDINFHDDDQHIALPEEIQRKFDWFPDAGAHSDVQVSSMISHMMLKRKGLQQVEVSRRAEADIIDQDGNIVYYKGEAMVDEDGEILSDSEPIIDEAFGDALFEASGVPDDKRLRKCWDTTQIPYNPGNTNRDKLKGPGKGYGTVADLIRNDWTFPAYEIQRPGGAYIVDTAPVNTMVLAITRGGKGQTYIEPMIDIWSREKKPSNMVINDPKGELLVNNYIPLVMRGFEPVQFNLINSMKTDIYNPLGLAADKAREGDMTKAALYVGNIAEVFFPTDGGEDPVWPNAASNAFKRILYGLIDFYMEEERELRKRAAETKMDPATLEQKLDDMWGKVTLYNAYQMFVQLSSKKVRNPEAELEKKVKAGEFEDREEELEEAQAEAQRQAFLWEGKAEQDMLTLYFNATEALPVNSMRTLIGNAHNALRSMAGAEKMLASVYGIAITGMSFFTDPTISTLTSGKPSQNTDLAGLSFPRRLGVRLANNYVKRDHLIGKQAVWSAYGDPMFQKNLGEDFDHEEIVGREGWARYNFKGKFPTDEAWLKLELVNPQTKMLVRTFYFHFRKSYQLSLNGRHYVIEPVTGKKIVKNGVLRELRPVREGGKRDGAITGYKPGDTTYKEERLDLSAGGAPERVTSELRAITQTMVRYSESPKAVFLVTPPHLMQYAKLVLILVKQLVDVSFDQSYMTKSNQKPLYRTRYMLDELGNLQSEGKGISGFETMLSIGLGQEQQFTLILQTLQQLRDVYGESVDKIVQGNAAPLGSLIATASGWQRMGDTQVGDEILTPFGTRTTVTGVFPKGTRPVYRVTLRDGSSSEVCEQHLWQTERWKSAIRYLGGKDEDGRRRYEGAGSDGSTVVRVSEVIDTLELKRRVDAGRPIDLPRISPLDYDAVDLPVDPYVLGVILGDGHVQKNGVVKFTCADREILAEIESRGCTVVKDVGAAEIAYRINGVNANMRALGLAGKRSWEKSIPEAYLYASVEQRLDLLRGLMDTDGTISASGEMEFTSASRELADGVQALVRSLGGRVAINVKTGITYTSPNQLEPKPARDAYRAQNIRLQSLNPFLLPRKADRWRPRTDNSGNRVVSVEYVREEQVQCISVADERHLYVMNDYMPTHNTSNIVFLKSTDDSMIETLEKMSGKTHVSYIDSKQISQDLDKMIGGRTEGRVSYTKSTVEEPLIKYNNMAFIPERNSIVFRAGDAPVWNRNETILPMSYKLLRTDAKMIHPGHDYSLQTIPTLSSAMEFDVLQNQPDFQKMFYKRLGQSVHAANAKSIYQESYGYEDVDIARLDPDTYADAVMEIVHMLANVKEGRDPHAPIEVDSDDFASAMMFDEDQVVENVEVAAAVAEKSAMAARQARKIYAEGTISQDMLVSPSGAAKIKSLDIQITEAYKAALTELQQDRDNFSVGGDGSLRSADGAYAYITPTRSASFAEAAAKLNAAAEDDASRVYADEDLNAEGLQALTTVEISPHFYKFLASLPTWEHLADGAFDRAMAQEMLRDA